MQHLQQTFSDGTLSAGSADADAGGRASAAAADSHAPPVASSGGQETITLRTLAMCVLHPAAPLARRRTAGLTHSTSPASRRRLNDAQARSDRAEGRARAAAAAACAIKDLEVLRLQHEVDTLKRARDVGVSPSGDDEEGRVRKRARADGSEGGEEDAAPAAAAVDDRLDVLQEQQLEAAHEAETVDFAQTLDEARTAVDRLEAQVAVLERNKQLAAEDATTMLAAHDEALQAVQTAFADSVAVHEAETVGLSRDLGEARMAVEWLETQVAALERGKRLVANNATAALTAKSDALTTAQVALFNSFAARETETIRLKARIAALEDEAAASRAAKDDALADLQRQVDALKASKTRAAQEQQRADEQADSSSSNRRAWWRSRPTSRGCPRPFKTRRTSAYTLKLQSHFRTPLTRHSLLCAAGPAAWRLICALRSPSSRRTSRRCQSTSTRPRGRGRPPNARPPRS